ncbi:MAG TPA: lipoprotein-releasing ABC transporter permease subunit [Desulfobacteraceae bacterium]|nr:lipoprotein-releasing ABC transporter permease subunit [Desulfobacteraceae bacterium]
MSFELFLAYRYLKSKKRHSFISFITIISILGVTVGVMALIVVLSVMNGFRADLMKKILGVNSHILVMSYSGNISKYRDIIKSIRSVKGIISATPFIYTQVMIRSGSSVSGAVLRGIDVDSVAKVVEIKDMIKGGNLEDLKKYGGKAPPVIVGKELCKIIGVNVGSMVNVISPYGRITPVGRVPLSKNFRICGYLDSGLYDFDTSMLFVELSVAQELVGIGDMVSGIEVRVKDPDKSDIIGREIINKLGYPFWFRDWKQMNRSLMGALKLEKLTMFVILTMIVLVGALNIISALIMVVMEKTKDIAILRSMGARTKSIMKIFIYQGLIIGTCGTILGISLGLLLCAILDRYPFIKLPSDIYYISTLPVKVQGWDIVLIAICAILISFFATIYPSIYASRLDPVEAIRYE